MEGDKKDVGFLQDSVNVLGNMINAENHAINSALITKNDLFLEIAEMIRKDRSEILYSLVKENNGESYCLSKHILASANGLKELGNRLIEKDDKIGAKKMFERAETYEKLFILINQEVKK